MEYHETNDQPKLFKSVLAPKMMEERKAQLFMFVKEHAHELFVPEDFEGIYKNKTTGRTNKAPEMLARVLLLQYLTQASDYQAMDAMRYDVRWKNVLGIGLDEGPGFDRTTLVKFRGRLLAENKVDVVFQRSIQFCHDHGLITDVEMNKLFVDSTAIFGYGAVKDTYNLLWDGLRDVIRKVSRHFGEEESETCKRLDFDFDAMSSIKSQLDIDWSDGISGREALTQLVDHVVLAYDKVKALGLSKELSDTLDFLGDIVTQDVEVDEDDEYTDGGCKLKRGVSKDRKVSFIDQDMRHGRKSKRSRYDGHKLHIGTVGKAGVVVSVGVDKGNASDGTMLRSMVESAEERLESSVCEIHTDRGYDTIENRDWLSDDEGRAVTDLKCKPRRYARTGKYTKADFEIDLARGQVICPGGSTASVIRDKHLTSRPLGEGCGGKAQFDLRICERCSLRSGCTKVNAKSGRRIAIHPYEKLHQEQHKEIKTISGRAAHRSRVVVEHTIGNLINMGLRSARYIGLRKTELQAMWTCAALNIRKVAYKQINAINT